MSYTVISYKKIRIITAICTILHIHLTPPTPPPPPTPTTHYTLHNIRSQQYIYATVIKC